MADHKGANGATAQRAREVRPADHAGGGVDITARPLLAPVLVGLWAVLLPDHDAFGPTGAGLRLAGYVRRGGGPRGDWRWCRGDLAGGVWGRRATRAAAIAAVVESVAARPLGTP